MQAYLGCVLSLFFLTSYAETLDADRDAIQQRIQPAGHAYVQTDNLQDSAQEVTETKPISQTQTPQMIYQKHCTVCHENGLAGAPKFRDEAMWKPRVAQGIDALLASALKGKNAMPAKGTCQECTDSDIKATIEYMAPQK